MRFFGFPGDFPTNPFPQKGKKPMVKPRWLLRFQAMPKSMDSASHEMSGLQHAKKRNFKPILHSVIVYYSIL